MLGDLKMNVLGAKMLLESREFSGNKSYIYMTPGGKLP